MYMSQCQVLFFGVTLIRWVVVVHIDLASRCQSLSNLLERQKIALIEVQFTVSCPMTDASNNTISGILSLQADNQTRIPTVGVPSNIAWLRHKRTYITVVWLLTAVFAKALASDGKIQSTRKIGVGLIKEGI